MKNKKMFTKEGKDMIKRVCNTFTQNFSIGIMEIASVVGFILSQFVWIYILKGFLNWFVLWFVEVTQYDLYTIAELKKVFWVTYGIWFICCILLRFVKIKTFKEVHNDK